MDRKAFADGSRKRLHHRSSRLGEDRRSTASRITLQMLERIGDRDDRIRACHQIKQIEAAPQAEADSRDGCNGLQNRNAPQCGVGDHRSSDPGRDDPLVVSRKASRQMLVG